MKHFDKNFYGTGTVGERGQIVIPAEARDELNIKAGDKFIFFGHAGIIHMMKAEEMDSILDRIHDKLELKFSKMKAKINSKIKGEKDE